MRYTTSAFILLMFAATVSAQTPESSHEPRIRRWFELQTFTIYSRYRFIENSAGRTTADQLQYKQALRARLNLDKKKRYTINVGYFSGGSFISSWNNWGVGTGAFNGKDNYLKQLYASAEPVSGVEAQYGGMYLVRGENDDLTSYDDDGYVVGERLSMRRSKMLYFDEISVTRGSIGAFNQPYVMKRWNGLADPDYSQVLAGKRLNRMIAGSIDYSTQAGAKTVRAAVTFRFTGKTPVNTFRYEQYRRVTNHAASGFAVWADRSWPRGSRLQAGYATVDRFYGSWNSDRIQSGRRFFAVLTVPIIGPLSGQLFGTQALSSTYPISLKKRYEAVVSYDVLSTLRRTGVF